MIWVPQQALFILPGVVLAKRYIYAPYIAASKELGPLDAMRESSRLSMINGWRVFWISGTIAILSAALYYGVDFLISAQPASIAPADGNLRMLLPLAFINEFLSNWVNYIWMTVFVYLMYTNASRLSPCVEEVKSQKAALRGTGSISSIHEDRLLELKNLLDKGLIDESEYRDAKRKELGI